MPDNKNNTFIRELRAGDCPGVEKLDSYRLYPEREAGTGAHLKSCAACQAEFALLREFQQPRAETAQETADLDWILSQKKKPAASAANVSWFKKWFGSGAYGAMAAVAAALLLAAGIQWQMQQRSLDIPKVIGDGGVERSTTIDITVPQAGDVNVAPAEARWKAVAGAARYEVALVEVDGNVIWTRNTDALSADLTTAKVLFLPRKTVGIRVRAKSADGRMVAESGEVRVRVIR